MQRNQSEDVFYTAELIRGGLLYNRTNKRRPSIQQNQSEEVFYTAEPIRGGLLDSGTNQRGTSISRNNKRSPSRKRN